MQGTIKWMNTRGDTLALWDTEIEESTDAAKTVADAEAFLREHQAAGRLVFNTRDKKIMDTFDPTAEVYIITPQMAGGRLSPSSTASARTLRRFVDWAKPIRWS